MSRTVSNRDTQFQAFTRGHGISVQHECDMRCVYVLDRVETFREEEEEDDMRLYERLSDGNLVGCRTREWNQSVSAILS
jgi:hypothetical protein